MLAHGICRDSYSANSGDNGIRPRVCAWAMLGLIPKRDGMRALEHEPVRRGQTATPHGFFLDTTNLLQAASRFRSGLDISCERRSTRSSCTLRMERASCSCTESYSEGRMRLLQAVTDSQGYGVRQLDHHQSFPTNPSFVREVDRFSLFIVGIQRAV